jgi:hypothetical protein
VKRRTGRHAEGVSRFLCRGQRHSHHCYHVSPLHGGFGRPAQPDRGRSRRTARTGVPDGPAAWFLAWVRRKA